MVSIAVLHETVPDYIKADNKHFELVIGTDGFETFKNRIAELKPQVLLLDLSLLGHDPVAAVQQLEKLAKPESTVIVYSFAKRTQINELRGAGRQVLRGPVKMQDLRTSLINLIVRDLTKRPVAPRSAMVPEVPPPAVHYSQEQLARLQEIQSAVDCECPNHVSDVIISLKAFEDYSKQCESRNAEDAKIHDLLYRAAGHARAMMEHAMRELCKFEGIDLEKTPVAPAFSRDQAQPLQ